MRELLDACFSLIGEGDESENYSQYNNMKYKLSSLLYDNDEEEK